MDSLGEKAVRLLSGVVDEDTLSAYLRLLAAGGSASQGAADLFGGTGRVQTLIRAGMAEFRESAGDRPPVMMPVPVDLALQRALTTLARDVLADHIRLVDGYQRMRELSASTAPHSDGSVEQLVQIITDADELERLASTLFGSVQRDWMALSNRTPTEPTTVRRDTSNLSPMGGGTRHRAIYEASCTGESTACEKLEAMLEVGVDVRLLPRVHMSVILADEAIALVPLTSSESGGALLIQSSVVVWALREYLELLWERAIPLGAGRRKDDTVPEVRVKILRLLVQGLPDEVVAQRVMMSLATVRRHIKSIREELGAETRFELGVVAVQRGIVD